MIVLLLIILFLYLKVINLTKDLKNNQEKLNAIKIQIELFNLSQKYDKNNE